MFSNNKLVFLWRTRPYLWWLEICKQAKVLANVLLLGGPDYHAAITEAYNLLKEAHCLSVIADSWKLGIGPDGHNIYEDAAGNTILDLSVPPPERSSEEKTADH